MTGPPNVPPNWFCTRAVVVAWKKFRAFSERFLRNSKTVPWNSFVPDRVTTFTTPPVTCPYWAS